ncbi:MULTISPECIES: hypothetical protein [Delftia]|uniref:Uncharacterized protein n=1 Tax=Delftia deserti TaxID=1651218 RepID=A0ABW5EMD1_9BURK|nr:hypothetical protein [Delftia sp. UME58]MBL8354152.1 hypothetical protein [Delftia acidovorans]
MDGSLHFLRTQHRQPLAHAPAAGLCTGLPAPISSPAARARTELAAGAGKGQNGYSCIDCEKPAMQFLYE